ncbi:hypothetical protein ACFS33_19685 [Cellulomonas phragmiteti]|uniref:hypothetical protein n=1 Tax=Cellulomonas phragmiteti TaxID=478780 RepID=UPI00363B9719
MGNPESLVEESHGAAGLLEYPVYTKPPSWQGHDVPDVLLSGHHARIARWRRDQALRRTAVRRPDCSRRSTWPAGTGTTSRCSRLRVARSSTAGLRAQDARGRAARRGRAGRA